MSIKGFGDINPLDLINTGKVGLLNSSNTYNVERYSWAYEYWKRQQQVHWLGEEIPMGEDVQDWQSDKLTDKDRNLLMQIFRFFTQSDIEVGENYLKRYVPIFQPLEIKMMMSSFVNMETVHIDAYALLLKTLGIPNSEFEAFKEYKSMTDKADYMHTFGIQTCSDVARTLAMFGAFTEGMALFASFAMLLNFPRNNKMKGMGQVITWSVRDESLHCEAMVKLYHEWAKETKSVTKSVQNDILDIADTMVKLEDKFIDLAFECGEVEGMNDKDIKSYIRYITDWRLTQLDLPTKFGFFKHIEHNRYEQINPHPLPWLTEILNGVEHANFFEQRATEYSKASTQGRWEGGKGVWDTFDAKYKNLGMSG